MNIDWAFWISMSLVCTTGWVIGWALCKVIDQFFHWRKMCKMIERLGPCSCGESHPERSVRLDLDRELRRISREDARWSIR